MTEAEYLEIERKAEFKSEYFRGEMFGTWLLKSASRSDDIVELTSVGCRLKLGDLYEKVEFVVEPRGQMRPLNPA